MVGKLIRYSFDLRTTQSLCKDVMSLGPELLMNISSYDTLLMELHKRRNAAIVIDSLCGTTIDANRPYLKMLGYSLKEIRTLTYQQLTPAKWHEMGNDLFFKVLKTGYSGIYEKEYIRKDGSVIPIRMEAWIIVNDKNRPDRLLGIVWNLSGKKQ